MKTHAQGNGGAKHPQGGERRAGEPASNGGGHSALSDWDSGKLFVKGYHDLLYDSRLRNGDAEVWQVMRDLANRKNHQCRASVATLCARLGISKNALIPARKRLLKAGWCEAKGRWNDTKIFTMRLSQDAAQYSRKRNCDANEIPEKGIVSGTEGESNKIEDMKKMLETLVRQVPFQGITIGREFIEPKTMRALYGGLLRWMLGKFDTIAGAEEWGRLWIEYYAKPADPLDKFDGRAKSLVAFASKATHFTVGIAAYIKQRKPDRKIVPLDTAELDAAVREGEEESPDGIAPEVRSETGRNSVTKSRVKRGVCRY